MRGRMMPGWRRDWAGSRATAPRRWAWRCCSLLVVAAIFAPLLATYPGDVADFHPANRLQRARRRELAGHRPHGQRQSTAASCSAPASPSPSPSSPSVAPSLIGVPIGLVAGYYGGWPSDLLMRVSDIFLAVPQIVLAIAIAQTLGPSIENVILALVVTYWPWFARLVYRRDALAQERGLHRSGDRARRLAAGA